MKGLRRDCQIDLWLLAESELEFVKKKNKKQAYGEKKKQEPLDPKRM